MYLISSHALTSPLRAEPGAIALAEGERPRFQRDRVLDAGAVHLRRYLFSTIKLLNLFSIEGLRHLVNAAFCLPGWGLGVGGKTLRDLRACLVIHLKKCEVKSRALFLVLMILLFLFTLIARSERQAPWSLKAK